MWLEVRQRISYFLPQKFCPWSLETLAVYLPYPSVIITCTNILSFLEICLFLLIEWMLGDIVFFGFDFSAHAMLWLQLADGVWPSFIKRITYLLTFSHGRKGAALISDPSGSVRRSTLRLRPAALGHVSGRPRLSPRVLSFTSVTHFCTTTQYICYDTFVFLLIFCFTW